MNLCAIPRKPYMFSLAAVLLVCLDANLILAQNGAGRPNANDARMQREQERIKQMIAKRLGDKEEGFFVVALSSTQFEMVNRANTRSVPRTTVDVFKLESRSAAVSSIIGHMSGGAPQNARTQAPRDWRFIGRYETAEQADTAVQQAKARFNPQPINR